MTSHKDNSWCSPRCCSCSVQRKKSEEKIQSEDTNSQVESHELTAGLNNGKSSNKQIDEIGLEAQSTFHEEKEESISAYGSSAIEILVEVPKTFAKYLTQFRGTSEFVEGKSFKNEPKDENEFDDVDLDDETTITYNDVTSSHNSDSIENKTKKDEKDDSNSDGCVVL